MSSVHAQIIILAGPSGAGKSRLAERIGRPVLRLDDFYKDGTDRRGQRKPGRLGPSGVLAPGNGARHHPRAALHHRRGGRADL